MQKKINKSSQLQAIKDANFKIECIDEHLNSLFTGAISNNLKYIVVGGDNELLKIWKFKNNMLAKSIIFDVFVQISKFTDDSHFLYIGTQHILYQLYVNNKFKRLCKLDIHDGETFYNI